jgi:hypothetical protein
LVSLRTFGCTTSTDDLKVFEGRHRAGSASRCTDKMASFDGFWKKVRLMIDRIGEEVERSLTNKSVPRSP